MQCRFSKARIIDTFFSGLKKPPTCDTGGAERPICVARPAKNADRRQNEPGLGTEIGRTCNATD